MRIPLLILVTLAVICSGCGGGGGSRSEYKLSTSSSITDNVGQARIYLPSIEKELQVTVFAESGTPIPNARVTGYSDDKGVVVLAQDPTGQRRSSIRSLTFEDTRVPVLLAIGIGLAIKNLGESIAEFVTDPPTGEITELGNGSIRTCVTGDGNDILAIMGLAGTPAQFTKLLRFRLPDRLINLIVEEGTESALEQNPTFKSIMDMNVTICYNPNLLGSDGKPFITWVDVPSDSSFISPPPGVTLSLSATGRASGHVANLQIANNASNSISGSLFPGHVLLNSSSQSRQNLAVLQSVNIIVDAFANRTIAVYGTCINLTRGAPANGDRFTIQTELRQDLVQVCRVIDQMSYSDSVAAGAVWAITDQRNPGAHLAAVRSIFSIAQLDPDQYPALNGQRSSDPTPTKVFDGDSK